MQSAGIWLVDASVTALYQNGTKLVSGADYFAVLRACWDSHIGEVVRECKPPAILIVGKGVKSAIGEKVQGLGRGIEVVTIKAPAAFMSAEAITHDRRACFDLFAAQWRSSSGSLAKFAAIRRASSLASQSVTTRSNQKRRLSNSKGAIRLDRMK